MECEHYYVYCEGILGVKTNDKNFRWIYGSEASESSKEEYLKCAVKFEIRIVPEKLLDNVSSHNMTFQAYAWEADTKTIRYRRTLPLNIKIGYNIRIESKTVCAEIGSHYYKFIRNRTMNLHGVYYLLSDIANVLLLDSGYITLYGSCVYHKDFDNSVLCFAAPSTGKTLLATAFCKKYGYALVGEDIVISDGKKIYSCPWTTSYKNRSSLLDSAVGSTKQDDLGEIRTCSRCDLKHIAVLVVGNNEVIFHKEEILRRVCILNGYLFHYFSSPIIKIFNYFDANYDKPWNFVAETILRDMVYHSHCLEVRCENRDEFADKTYCLLSGEVL